MCITPGKVEMEMMSSVYKFKMATRQNLMKNEVMLLFHWLMFFYCFTVWQGQRSHQRKMKGAGRSGFSIPERQGELWWIRDGGPPSQYTTHPQPGSPHPQERRRRGRWRRQRSGWRKQDGWRMWEGLHHHCQPNSWPRWLWRLGHLLWVRRSKSGGRSNLLWEAKPPRRNSSRLERSRRPGSTGLAQLLFERSGSSKRALSSSLGNSPSCG